MCAESAPPCGQNLHRLILAAVIKDLSSRPDAGQTVED